MAETAPFRFGVEVELLLESRGWKKHNQWKPLADELSGKLAKADVDNHVDDLTPVKNYTEWSIAREITVRDINNPSAIGVELVSPIYSSTAVPSLTAELTTIFATIRKNFVIHPSPHCSTHIHVSQPSTPFAPSSLAALAKAVLYFESALDSLMPNRTAETYWARPNRSPGNPELAGLTLPQALSKIDEMAAVEEQDNTERDPLLPLVKAMNLVTGSSNVGRARDSSTEDRMRGKTYRWDFTGLLRSSYPSTGKGDGAERSIAGTVEFRQPPGSGTAGEAVAWAVLGVAFVVGAGVVGGSLSVGGEEAGGTLKELWEMLERGREVVGWGDLKVLEGMFKSVGQGKGA
ncbi:hypothetical protein C8A05DRAFT_18862 [Staphylotrichum tortipilum]|uniref:Amidoligase enzyme n=1 Tax=Staphylotrichum tortipilum TaxID=2831512 RepID=A0AAN6RQC6_9PEZI|nr:hypothetical protein C8A05DRAFT_18862 [Staphylotrichum longicolle]